MASSGQVASFFLAAVLLTVLGSLLVLYAYLRTVRRNMQRAPSASQSMASLPMRRAVASPEGDEPGVVSARALQRRLILVYGVSGLLCGATMSALYFGLTKDVDVTVFRFVLVAYAFAWPVVASLAWVLGSTARRSALLALAYVLLGVLITIAWSWLSRLLRGDPSIVPLDNVAMFARLLGTSAGPPVLILLFVTGGSRIRLVSPILFCGLLVFGLGAILLEGTLVRALDRDWLRSLILSLGYTLTFVIASMPVGYLCWVLQRWLGAAYQAKLFSEKQLVADTWWFVAIFFFALDLAAEIGLEAAMLLGVFVGYRCLVHAGLRFRRVSDTRPPPRSMLVLRTFDATRRVERLFDAVVERWRFTGSVQLIGAPDLAQRTIDPGDLLLFLAGRFESHFVQSPDDLKRRLQALDVRRDPDGRFRVNDFYCFDSTWQEALVALLLESDVVLMDLRGLSAVNRGCQFELTKLVEHHKLGQTLLVVDDTTDETLLHATLEEAMRDLGESALQQTALQPEVVRLGNGRVRDLDRMFDALVSLNGSNGAGGEHIGG